MTVCTCSIFNACWYKALPVCCAWSAGRAWPCKLVDGRQANLGGHGSGVHLRKRRLDGLLGRLGDAEIARAAEGQRDSFPGPPGWSP